MTLQEYANAGRKQAELSFGDGSTSPFWDWNGPGWYAKEYISKKFGSRSITSVTKVS